MKLVGTQFNDNKSKFSDLKSFSTLKNDLDEVEELTSRVRDSISVDLLNTRRYSPLLYEYYRKHLEVSSFLIYFFIVFNLILEIFLMNSLQNLSNARIIFNAIVYLMQ